MKRFSRFGIVAALLAGGLVAAQPALAAGGTALGVKQQAELQADGAVTVLEVGKDIQIGDEVRTGSAGQVQIKFDDATELVVGPNSKLLIEDYLLRGDNSAGKLAINALAGTFRFATGSSAKDRYKISTPTGTIGVRGTEFDFVVDEDGTKVLLYEGGVRICSTSGQCAEITDPCSLGVYDDSEANDTGATTDMTRADRALLRKAFKYASDQSPLIREFWFNNSRQCLNPPANPQIPSGWLEGGSSGFKGETKPEEPNCEGQCCDDPRYCEGGNDNGGGTDGGTDGGGEGCEGGEEGPY